MGRQRAASLAACALVLACADAFRGAPAPLRRVSVRSTVGARRVGRVGLAQPGGVLCRLRAQASPQAGELPVCVILPGFGNAAVDYSSPFGAEFETSISYALERRGYEVRVMPLLRKQWLNVLWGVFDLSFWLGKVTPYEKSYGWYVQMARDIIADAGAKGSGVIVIGHSAGGWLGRAALGDGSDFDADIRAFVSLGAPHSPPPEVGRGGGVLPPVCASVVQLTGLLVVERASARSRGAFCSTRCLLMHMCVYVCVGVCARTRALARVGECSAVQGIPGVMDMTRGALTWTDKNLPGSFLAEKGVQYVSVASDLITGSDLAERGTPAKAAYDSYRLVCGAGDVPGDGVVPLQSAHLEDAAQITMQVFAVACCSWVDALCCVLWPHWGACALWESLRVSTKTPTNRHTRSLPHAATEGQTRAHITRSLSGALALAVCPLLSLRHQCYHSIRPPRTDNTDPRALWYGR